MDLFANNFVAVDFETATPQKMACQIGIAVVENGEIINTIVRLIQPPNNYYDYNCVRVHHIRSDRTAESPTFAELWPEIKGYLENNVVVAHNAPFDESTLRKNLEYYGIADDNILPFKDTMWYRGKRYKLDELCVGFGLPTDGHHDAGWDAEMCARIYLLLLAGQEPNQHIITEYRKANGKGSALPHILNMIHFEEQHIRFYGLNNILCNREIYVGKGLRKRCDCFFQLIGNLGAFANKEFFPETDTILLTNKSMELLKRNEKDETIALIQDFYDHQPYPYIQDFEYLTEQDVLDFVNLWCDTYEDDDITRTLYNIYVAS